MDVTINSAMGIAGQTVASLYANIPVKLVLLVAAVLFCFAGYKLLRWGSALCGVVLGVVLGVCATSLLGTSMAQAVNFVFTIAAMVVLGTVFGILCFRLYQIGVFLACGCIGAAIVFVPALFVAQPVSVAFWAILAVCAVLFGVTGVLFLRPAGILITGLFGFAVSAIWMDFAGGETWIAAAAGLGLTAAGWIVQLLTNRGAGTHPSDRRKKQSSSVAGEEKSDAGAHLRAPVLEEDGISDCTQVLDMRALQLEEPDEIDSISDVVAAHISLSATAPLSEEEAMGTEPLWPEDAQQAGFAGEEPAAALDVPLEQQAKFAWLMEEPVEAPGQDNLNEEADDASGETPEQQEQTPLTGCWNDVVAPALEEPAAAVQVSFAESDEQAGEADGELEPEQTAVEQAEPKEKIRRKRIVWPVLLTVAALAFAAVGIQYVEIALALCFVCYVLRYYRVAAFACAVLCMRRVVDVVLFVMQNGSRVSIGLDVLSAVIFLALTFAAIHAYSRTRHAPEHETEE